MIKKYYDFNKQEDNGELIIRDSTGRKIDTFTFDKKSFPKIIEYIKKKYGFNMEMSEEDKEKIEKDDINWLDMTTDFFSE